MTDPFTPLLDAYHQHLLRRAALATAEELSDRDCILPLISALNEARQATRTGDPSTALDRTVQAGHLLALNAYRQGTPEARITAFTRTQQNRHATSPRSDWPTRPARHHWDRALANAVSVARHIDHLQTHPGDPARLRAQSADTANYTLYLLHTAGIAIPSTPTAA